MPLRLLKNEIETLKALLYIYSLVRYVVEKHPSIVTEFKDQYRPEE